MTLHLPVRAPGAVLAVTTVLLTLVALVLHVLYFGFGRDHVLGLARFFDLAHDDTIPTWYASATLALSALLLGAHWLQSRRTADPDARYWVVLALLFLLFSIDEVARIHERAGGDLARVLIGESGGVLSYRYRWVGAGVLFAAVVAVSYLRFLARLPARVCWGMVAAGAIFLSGALGMEMLNSYSAWRHAEHALALGTIAEEFLEMAGIALFVHVLSRYLAERAGSVTVHLIAPATRTATPAFTATPSREPSAPPPRG